MGNRSKANTDRDLEQRAKTQHAKAMLELTNKRTHCVYEGGLTIPNWPQVYTSVRSLHAPSCSFVSEYYFHTITYNVINIVIVKMLEKYHF